MVGYGLVCRSASCMFGWGSVRFGSEFGVGCVIGCVVDFMFIRLLYLLGGILVVVVLAIFFLYGMRVRDLGKVVKEFFSVLLSVGFVLLFTVPMVCILINSGVNGAELSSMLIFMVRWVADSVGGIYLLLVSSIGVLGAFIAGSNIVSNMMFS